MKPDLDDVTIQVQLPDGSRIILCDRLSKKDRYSRDEQARNIFLIGPDGQILWQVQSKFDHNGGPFTNLRNENGKFFAYRWDGGEYLIDPKSGFATPLQLVK